MFEGIYRISNPVARMAMAAGVGLTAATMISGAIIGFKPEKQDEDFRVVGYGAIAGAAVGAAYGLLRRDSGGSVQAAPVPPPELATPGEWRDWRNLVVTRKVVESSEITSFYLQPQDGGSLPSFQPGQFLTIKLDIPDQPRPVIRTYSLSDYDHTTYRLSIKREPAPKGLDVPPGLASNFLHDHVQEGTVLPAKPPNGRFVLDLHSSRPAILLSNGVGITPMMAMARAVVEQGGDRPVWFVHGARDGEAHAFFDEVSALAQRYPHLQVYYRYSRPRPEDAGRYHSEGYVDPAMLTQVIAPDLEQRTGAKDADYFLCGSPSFMDALLNGLKEQGVPQERVFFESFNNTKPKGMAPPVSANGSGEISAATVTFVTSGKVATWHPDDGTLLEFAEAQGLEPDYSCRAGICLTCMCRLKEGEVVYETPPTGTPDEGSVLICISKPKTDRVVLEL
ncbi:MAG: 2Fe-2S iron-sulfur cluster-binding protein [Synechococcales bacterium]|nr:2Fe-2S iron-sulfur cluster-binding protein [Synechococcales bacterium]